MANPWFMTATIPFLPPSSNHLYVGQGKRRRLHPQAEAFRARFNGQIAQKMFEINQLPHDGIKVFFVMFDFYFPTLLNKSWDGTAEGAKTRYKKLDVSRRITFVEDCFAKAIGVDDLYSFGVCGTKHHDPDNPRIEILIVERDPTEFGIPLLEVPCGKGRGR